MDTEEGAIEGETLAKSNTPEKSAGQSEPDVAKVNQQGLPACPIHGSVMLANGTGENATYYYCQVETCGRSQKVVHRSHAFAKPVFCPLAVCRHNHKGKSLALEIIPGGAENGRLLMKCPDPKCGYQATLTDPRMKGIKRPSRAMVDLGER